MFKQLRKEIKKEKLRRQIKEKEPAMNKLADGFEKILKNSIVHARSEGGIYDITANGMSLLKDQFVQEGARRLERYCQAKIVLKENNETDYINKFRAEVLQNKPHNAIFTLEQYLNKNPTDAKIYEEIANLQDCVGNEEEAQKNYGLAERMRKYES